MEKNEFFYLKNWELGGKLVRPIILILAFLVLLIAALLGKGVIGAPMEKESAQVVFSTTPGYGMSQAVGTVGLSRDETYMYVSVVWSKQGLRGQLSGRILDEQGKVLAQLNSRPFDFEGDKEIRYNISGVSKKITKQNFSVELSLSGYYAYPQKVFLPVKKTSPLIINGVYTVELKKESRGTK